MRLRRDYDDKEELLDHELHAKETGYKRWNWWDVNVFQTIKKFRQLKKVFATAIWNRKLGRREKKIYEGACEVIAIAKRKKERYKERYKDRVVVERKIHWWRDRYRHTERQIWSWT